MRRARSRNFILMVCGILITLLLGFVIAKSITSVIDEVSNVNKSEELQKNILSSSSKIKLYGKGNFIETTPKIEKTIISNYNVKLTNKDDEVYYSISFCNMNDEDMMYKDLIIESVSCIDPDGNDDCTDIDFNNYVMKKKRKLDENMIVSANSCVDVVIDTKYIGNEAVETEVFISRVVLLLDEVKR